MYELKKNGKVFTSKSVGTGPSSYEKRIYRAAVSQRFRNTVLQELDSDPFHYHHMSNASNEDSFPSEISRRNMKCR